MIVRRCDDAAVLLEHTRAMLVADEIENSSMLATATRLANAHTAPSLAAWVESDQGVPLCAVVRGESPTAMLSIGPRAAIEALADDLAASNVPLRGVHSSDEAAEAFAARWVARTGKRGKTSLSTTVYAATSVKMPRDPGGAPRAARDDEVALLAPWFDAFAREAHVPIAGSAEAMARRNVAQGTLFVWDHAGVKCMAIGIDATESVARVAWVYTPPEARNHGYASALVAWITARALAAGKKACSLNADVTNPTSNAIYVRMGYVQRGGSKTIDFEP